MTNVDAPRSLRVTRQLSIPFDELRWRFSTSGGPGGQHANRSSTRVELRFDIEHSGVLGPRQRSRLLERFGPTVAVVAGEERSQARNREVALRRLTARLQEALRVERPRVATRPSLAVQARRLEEKRRRSSRKRERAFSGDEDA